MNSDIILVLDFGGNQAYYTARRLRGEQYYCEILPGNTGLEEILARAPKGLLLAGGDSASLRAEPLPFDPDSLGVPVLAFGGAARMLAEKIGAEHQGMLLKSDKDSVQFLPCDLFADLGENDRFFDRIDGFILPEGYQPIAATPSGLMPGFANLEKHIYGLQFYVESNDPDGLSILERFASSICGCQRSWTVENYAPALIEKIRAEVGESKVILPVSGGVDSTVTAALMQRAIGSRLSCLLVDTGLLRKGDAELVRKNFAELKINLVDVNAQERFLKSLRGVHAPKEKRAILHNEFAAVFAEQYIKAGDVECMAEGTIYPDVLHCKPALVTNMIDGCRMVEPLRLLFKEDVRALGRYLGVPEELVRQPSFESCGLSVRCLGEVTPERLAMLRDADAIFRQEVEKAGLNRKIAQYFAILTDMKTPGVHGEGYVCALRALGSSNAGKAPAFKLPYDLMEAVVQRITNEIPGITHVVYDITGRPTAAVEWE
ncbi:MAG: GMP synthase (glutamine-hydrolyzing) [Clostridia bacterium]|nr:GMP synthase (glutamine-hydrolyzing) [Clostridia bacterium]